MADIEYCDDPRGLILAGPIEDVVRLINQDLDALESLSPSSDVIPALTRQRERLLSALLRARRAKVYVSPQVAARYLRIGVPAVTRLCRLRHLDGEHIGSRWWIDRAALLRYGRRSR